MDIGMAEISYIRTTLGFQLDGRSCCLQGSGETLKSPDLGQRSLLDSLIMM